MNSGTTSLPNSLHSLAFLSKLERARNATLTYDARQWQRIEPHAAQQQVLQEARRFNVLDCGRRWGKSELGIDRAIDGLKRGLPVSWYAPTYKDAMEVWRGLKSILYDVTINKNEQEKRLEVVTGGAIEVWTLNDPDSSRGRKYGRAIIDEAAKIQHLKIAWEETIRPTLTDFKGDAWFLSTPKGRNFFWTLFTYGQDPLSHPDWMSWSMPTSSNPYIDPGEIEQARGDLPQRAFEQEYLAQFLEDGGAVFRNLAACATLPAGHGYLPARPDGHYLFGVDWGKSEDFTVIAVVDRDTRQCVHIERFNQIGWTLQRGRLKALYEKWQPYRIIAETNSMGDPNVEALQGEGLPVVGFQTTAQSKAPLIESLALAFEREELHIVNDPVLVSELQAYTMDRLPSGRYSYSAPAGMHDDTVIALALAWHGITHTRTIRTYADNPFFD